MDQNLNDMIAKAVSKQQAKQVPLKVVSFDWDNHITFKAKVCDIFFTTPADHVPYHHSIVGIDTGKRLPLPASVEFEMVPDRWIETEPDGWWDWNSEPFKPHWTQMAKWFMVIDGKRYEETDTTWFTFVATMWPSQIEARRGSGKTEVVSSRAKSDARKAAKRARDKAIRDKMRGGSNSKKK